MVADHMTSDKWSHDPPHPQTASHHDIMDPAWSFWSGGPAIATEPQGLGRWDWKRESLVAASEQWPWEGKRNTGFFRGSRWVWGHEMPKGLEDHSLYTFRMSCVCERRCGFIFHSQGRVGCTVVDTDNFFLGCYSNGVNT